MYMRVTVTALAPFALNDYLGLEAQDIGRDQPFVSQSFNAGDVKTFDVSESQWARLRAVLDKLSYKMFGVVDATTGLATGQYRNVLTYSAEPIPGNRARFLQVKGAVSLASATNTLTLNGENLIRGYAASGSMGIGTAKLSFAAQRKGPEANAITVVVQAASGAGSVTTTQTADLNGVKTTITVVPAAAGPGANAIAAQINADSLANFFVQATGGGTGTVTAASVTLSGGEGAGVAYAYYVNSSGQRLTVQARKPGCSGNLISLKILAASGAGSVAVTGNDIVVTPAAASDTVTAVVAQINADTAAKALVVASGVGAASTGVIAQNWLHGGAGEDAVLKVGSYVAKITTYTDSQVVATVDGTALAGYAAGDYAVVNLLVGFSIVGAQQLISA
jgi:hypothetical protein